MKKHRVELKVTGFVDAVVEAETTDDAIDKAVAEFDMQTPVADLKYGRAENRYTSTKNGLYVQVIRRQLSDTKDNLLSEIDKLRQEEEDKKSHLDAAIKHVTQSIQEVNRVIELNKQGELK